MSLVPLLLSTWLADLGRPPVMDQNLGFAALPQPRELVFPRAFDRYPFIYDHGVLDFYYRPWMIDLLPRKDGDKSCVTIDNDTFKVVIDVQQFKPEEVNVKVVGRYLIVTAKHEEKSDEHGSISRQFVQKYMLPERADVDQVKSTISSDGFLTITAPLKPKQPEDEKVIKIELTGEPAVRPSDSGEDESRVTEASTTVSVQKEDNEIREELTTQGQQGEAKPEK